MLALGSGQSCRQPSPAGIRKVHRYLKYAESPRRPGGISPFVSVQVPESNFFEPNWQRAYWGTNYSRLLAIKRAYDPTGLFFVHHGVGSEPSSTMTRPDCQMISHTALWRLLHRDCEVRNGSRDEIATDREAGSKGSVTG